jgi:hypothetical protein
MAGETPALRILVLSEDGSPHAHDTVVALAKTMLKIVDPAVQTQREKLRFDEERGDARRVMSANKWRSTNEDDEPAIRSLLRAIVRQLLIEDDKGRPNGFVFFHYDGDTTFANRETSEARQARQHFEDFRLRIEQQIKAVIAEDKDPDAIKSIMSRLLAIVPFYCIESWTYQHTDVAKKICTRGCGKHLELFDDWARDRGALDEIWKLWDSKELDCCLRKDHNVELTGPGYPAETVFNAGKSYYQVVDAMADCAALCAALKRTYAPANAG